MIAARQTLFTSCIARSTVKIPSEKLVFRLRRVSIIREVTQIHNPVRFLKAPAPERAHHRRYLGDNIEIRLLYSRRKKPKKNRILFTDSTRSNRI